MVSVFRLKLIQKQCQPLTGMQKPDRGLEQIAFLIRARVAREYLLEGRGVLLFLWSDVWKKQTN